MTRITVAKGDGIGPEIMDATIAIIKAAGAQIEIDEVEVGEKVYLAGNTAGIALESWDTIRRNKVFLKAPITTPQGGGYKSLNVTTRKFLGLYSNVRPCMSLHPFVSTKHPVMDIVIVRENEEDLYAGIEHQQTDEVVQCLKLISRPGCEKIVRTGIFLIRLIDMIILHNHRNPINHGSDNYKFTSFTVIHTSLFLPLSSVQEIFTGPSCGTKNCFSPTWHDL